MEDGSKQSVYTYDANGNRKTLTLPNSQTDTFWYDPLNRVTVHQSQAAGATVYSSEYGYDLVGNRLTIAEIVADADNPGAAKQRNMSYTYDDQYRLTSESWPASTGVLAESRAYTFDLAGNRLTLVQVKDGATATTVYAYDDLNRLLSATKDGVLTSYTYDLDGNRDSKAVAGGATDTYTWDVNDRLVSVSRQSGADPAVTVFTAAYDYRTRRVGKAGMKVVSVATFLLLFGEAPDDGLQHPQ
jgi:YD repeat-containing protein